MAIGLPPLELDLSIKGGSIETGDTIFATGDKATGASVTGPSVTTAPKEQKFGLILALTGAGLALISILAILAATRKRS